MGKNNGKANKGASNAFLRNAGYEDWFFTEAASWGIKVDSVKPSNDYGVRVGFVGVTGNTFKRLCVLPAVCSEDRRQEIVEQLRSISEQIAQHNPAIRAFRERKQALLAAEV